MTQRLGVWFLLLSTSVFAQNPPLRVSVAQFIPPFVMMGGNSQVFGYDVAMMQAICNIIQRDCLFDSMPHFQLIPSLVSNQADVAVGAIAITSERAAVVNFSMPYLPSTAQFITRSSFANQNSFSLKLLKDKTFGIEKGTVFGDEIERMGITDADVVEYDTEEELIEALVEEDIDAVLMDEPSTMYWEIHSSGALRHYGPVLKYAYGLGIAVNPNDLALLNEINQGLTQYLNSPLFKKNYNKYFGSRNINKALSPRPMQTLN